jgi:hypothetical protein
VAEETFSSEGAEDPSQAFSFAFFAASREENLLSKFVPNCGHSPCARVHSPKGANAFLTRSRISREAI